MLIILLLTMGTHGVKWLFDLLKLVIVTFVRIVLFVYKIRE